MENDENFDDLMSAFNNERKAKEDNENTEKKPRVVSTEELIQRVSKKTKIPIEKVREVFGLYLDILEELYEEDPNLFIEYLEGTLNNASKRLYENN